MEDSSAYWKGLWHGMLLLLPVLTFLYQLKAVRDQLKAAEEATPMNDKKVQALKERVVDVATVLQKKLETITPIVSFLLEQSVGVIKDHHANTSEGEANDESKKDK
ncbi:hypothetical protein AM588_10001379 [Phytophthora nicotianae]|uniref:Uncharacterized protein n=1 Tax=Phytophthora nicotianae TaxID=4792 RepID=A0A0W8CS80_PHYNI|nr:hypothetical protein AM588_10001379 [Phytophthora nicotianae]